MCKLIVTLLVMLLVAILMFCVVSQTENLELFSTKTEQPASYLFRYCCCQRMSQSTHWQLGVRMRRTT